MKRISLVLVLALTLIIVENALCIDFPIRIIGNKTEDYTDKYDNIWFAAQTEYDANSWGGWVEMQPNQAEVRTLTADAESKAESAGIDPEIFYAVSWQNWPNGVYIDVNTGNGTFKVTYLVGEHWSPENRGFNIIIEEQIVNEAYVTPAKDEIDILTFKGVTVTDEVMSLEFIGNPDTGAGDLNAMFSGLVIEQTSSTAVDPTDNLPTTWSSIKASY